MKAAILTGSAEFWARLEEDLFAARKRVFIQTLSFEGDGVGKMLSARLWSLSPGVDVRILVDSFSRFILNDKFLYAPQNLFDAELRREADETGKMIKELRQNGLEVRFTRPVGLVPTRLAARNHKKLIVIDDRITYIGGINFSEHNFGWHDMMLRMEEPRMAAFLGADFQSTWEGAEAGAGFRMEGMELHILDGRTNARVFGKILRLIEKAKKRIFVESPYLTFPILDGLKMAAKKGVAVTIIMPEENNYRSIKEYALWESSSNGIEIRLYPGMTHLKAMLIDDTHLILGSSNFDYLSYRLHEEIVGIITDKGVISEFEEKVVRQDLKNSALYQGRINPLKGHGLNLALRTLGGALAWANSTRS